MARARWTSSSGVVRQLTGRLPSSPAYSVMFAPGSSISEMPAIAPEVHDKTRIDAVERRKKSGRRGNLGTEKRVMCGRDTGPSDQDGQRIRGGERFPQRAALVSRAVSW